MKFKKIISSALAGALALSMSATAFAEDTTSTDSVIEAAGGTATTLIEGSVEALTIKVTVPSTGSVILNPYRLEVGTEKLQDSVINAGQFIKNESNVAVDVGVSVTGAVEGNAKLATAPVTADVTTNSVFMYFQMMEAEDGTTEPDWTDYTEASDILVGTRAVSKSGMVKMEAGDTTATFAAFHVAGEAASAPKTPWAATDKVNVTVAFTFTPVAAEVPTTPTPPVGG